MPNSSKTNPGLQYEPIVDDVRANSKDIIGSKVGVTRCRFPVMVSGPAGGNNERFAISSVLWAITTRSTDATRTREQRSIARLAVGGL